MRSIFTRESQSGLRAFFLILLAIILMVADRRVSYISSFRAMISLPLAPIQYVVNLPTELVSGIKNAMVSRRALIEENLKLKADALLLHSKLQRLIAIESENNYLKSLLQSSQQMKGNKVLIAELLAVDTEPFSSRIILNKGTRDGIYIGQPVLDASGVMGQVIEAGPITSRVLLINDVHSGIAVQSARNGTRAIVMGDSDSNNLRLMYVPKTADIRTGDLFMTSGLGDRFPEGYPVGRVVSVKKDPAYQFSTVYLQPSAHLNSSRQVLLLWSSHHA
ncbi:MAG: rod shape-determining protein MreC [Gammaproteobacteria bacterium RIFCSPHIGHO2_12_FULL_38_14]|nr:MAG: rod shape-determining protein MreC [Gammaproteobacteria bacterium RIFCSPHIGHO2_12_FULL_38_14]